MVRSAQQAGDFRMLYPRNADRAMDIPWFLQVAIEQALTILGWYEGLPKEDVPPEHLWEDPEGLEQWWADVEARREDGAPTARGRKTDSDSDEPPPDREMVENDYARALKRG